MKARKQQEFAKKWVGNVVVEKTGELKVKLTSIDARDGKSKMFPNGELSMVFSLADLPKAAKRLIKPKEKGENKPKSPSDGNKFRIRLNEDGDLIETITPNVGVFPAKLIGLGPKKQDGTYSLIHRVYNEGKENQNEHDEFIAIYEITEGPFRGVELPGYFLHYKFEECPEGDEDEGLTRFNTADTPQASQLHKLQAWAEVHGNILEEPIRWPDDGIILETLEERALDADRDVNLVFENGYIKTVQAVVDYGSGDEEESEDEFDAKFSGDEQEEEVVEVPAKTTTAVKNLAKKVLLGEDEKTPAKTSKAPVKPAAKSAKKSAPVDNDEDL